MLYDAIAPFFEPSDPLRRSVTEGRGLPVDISPELLSFIPEDERVGGIVGMCHTWVLLRELIEFDRSDFERVYGDPPVHRQLIASLAELGDPIMPVSSAGSASERGAPRPPAPHAASRKDDMSVDAPIELDVTGVEEFVPPEMDPERRGLLYGSHVAYALPFIDDAVSQIGCRSLRAFILEDDDVIYDDTPLERRAELEGRQWFRPEDALPVIRALEQHIASLDEPTVREYRWWRSSREGVLWDLRAYRLILEQAAREGQRFRIVRG